MVNRFLYPTVAIHFAAFVVAVLALSSDSMSSLAGRKSVVEPVSETETGANEIELSGGQQGEQVARPGAQNAVPFNHARSVQVR